MFHVDYLIAPETIQAELGQINYVDLLFENGQTLAILDLRSKRSLKWPEDLTVHIKGHQDVWVQKVDDYSSHSFALYKLMKGVKVNNILYRDTDFKWSFRKSGAPMQTSAVRFREDLYKEGICVGSLTAVGVRSTDRNRA